ncbi:glycosyltransferase [Pygmaiobacter massiliensis]|uniref:glycosyltransferase n=1 Tax=Pygmaiobacter massiliensis TaxID=1917873 RepID=UPI001FA8525A|nr:glycosyltransferase [Pygmaiobacter massiliensis]
MLALMSMSEYEGYSILMSVYQKEKPEYLRQAIESIQEQTLPTGDFVLVCDGPLNPELDAVIAVKQQEMGDTLNVVRLAKNGGLGNALNEGINHCKNELVARMDSDDIAYPNRCEKQITVFNLHPEVSICSGVVEEFTTNPEVVDAMRVPPETNAAIVEFAKKRNPFNHPCVMYKKLAVEAAGSYQDFYLLEDYYLWLRMLLAGYQGYNIQEPLLHMRAGSEMYLRRAGWKYAKTQARLFKYMKDKGFIGNSQYIKSCMIRNGSALAPNWMRKFVFEKVLRK